MRRLNELHKFLLPLLFAICISAPQFNLCQRTALDAKHGGLYRALRLLGWQFIGRSEDSKNLAKLQALGKTQTFDNLTYALSKFCDTENGPGQRSDTRPVSVHRLRPGDIDVVGAMGDSLTAGNGIFATNLLHGVIENRGAAWSIGGKGSWQTYLTLPNILKEFNPRLYGYSLKDGLTTERSSRFNVAEFGAMSRDIPHEAKVLVKRMERDPLVDMGADWKLITLLIGNNDFCGDMCYYTNPESVIKWHEQNMLATYRYLRDRVPRLMLNVVPAPNLRVLTKMTGLPEHCPATLRLECPCLLGKNDTLLSYYESIMKKWVAKDFEIASLEEFNTENFTINIQPFAQFKDLPRTAYGKTDLSILSEDCFHLSQRGHALSANAYWNNLLQKPADKAAFNPVLFEQFLCPTAEHPYIMTRKNSNADFTA